MERPVSNGRLDSANTPADGSRFFRRYAWIFINNILGWVLILTAIVLGSVFPIPLGTPMFLIGFTLITVPGKRHLTSAALRGIPIGLYTRKARMWRLAISLLLPPAIGWFLALKRHPIIHPSQMGLFRLCAIYAIAIVAAWVLTWLFLMAVNLVLRFMPGTRRRVRPWLRGHGINLLPPRRKSRNPNRPNQLDEQQILGFGREGIFGRGRDKA